MSWRRVTLSEATDLLTDGTHYTPPGTGHGVPFLTVKDVSDEGLDFVRSAKISEEEFMRAKSQNCAPQIGDVLFSKDGTVGKVHLVTETQPFAVLSSLAILRPGKQLDSGYLAHFLRTPASIEVAERRKTGSAIRRIVLRDLGQMSIPLPTLDEQRRIATILDKADALGQKRKRAIALLGSLTQAVFLEVFGEAAPSWPAFTIGELGRNIRTGPFGSQLLHSEFVDDGIAVLGIDNVVQNTFLRGKPRFITAEKYQSLGRYRVHPGDVLITIMGTIGRCAVVPDNIGDAINTKHLCCITPDTTVVIPEYLKACFLGHPEVLRQLGQQSKGAIMDGLNMGIIKNLSIPVPPLSLQQRFANSLEVVSNRLREAVESSVRHATLFASLQHRAFSGQLLEVGS